MASRKNTPAPLYDAASEFLQKELANGPRPATDVKNVALRERISPHMLEKASKDIVDKPRITGPDGKTRSYWKLRVSPRRARKGRTTIRKAGAEAAYKAGYEHAFNKMLQELAVISARKGRRPTASQIIEELAGRLRYMRNEPKTQSNPLK